MDYEGAVTAHTSGVKYPLTVNAGSSPAGCLNPQKTQQVFKFGIKKF